MPLKEADDYGDARLAGLELHAPVQDCSFNDATAPTGSIAHLLSQSKILGFDFLVSSLSPPTPSYPPTEHNTDLALPALTVRSFRLAHSKIVLLQADQVFDRSENINQG